MGRFTILLVILVILTAILGPQSFFTVDETRLAIVTRFGEPLRSIDKPGLYTKTPFTDTVTYFDKRLVLFDAQPDALLTEDKKRLVIDAYALGRIVEPLLFFKTVRNPQGAVTRGTDIIASDLRKEIANDKQSEIIKTLREPIMKKVTDTVAPKIREFGVEILDVKIMRADFPPEIADSIFARMQAERKRIADAERSEGAKRDLEIRAGVDRKVTIITAEAQRDANITRGEGEAEAVSIFAQAMEQDSEFYSFTRSLEAYQKFLTQGTTMVLPADSNLFQFLQSPLGANTGTNGQQDALATLQELSQIEAAARQLLAGKLELDPAAPTLTKLSRATWPDSSLGCPKPGERYAQVTLSGFSLGFEHGGSTYEVHANGDGSLLVICTPENKGSSEG